MLSVEISDMWFFWNSVHYTNKGIDKVKYKKYKDM